MKIYLKNIELINQKLIRNQPENENLKKTKKLSTKN